jgi:hypothetical protein
MAHTTGKGDTVMKTGIIRFLWVVVVAVLIASQAFSQTAKSAAPSGEPIELGGSLPLTGIFSESEKWIKAGYEFWAEDINKRGGLLGRPVKLILYDDESNADKAVTYYERAITVDKADLLLGGYPGTSGPVPLTCPTERASNSIQEGSLHPTPSRFKPLTDRINCSFQKSRLKPTWFIQDRHGARIN